MKILIAAFLCLLFSSCLEINEDVVINNNGGGTYSTKTDFSQMVEMMLTMGGEEIEKRKDEKVDTIFSLTPIVDTMSKLTPAEKTLLRNGTVNLKMHFSEKIFNMKFQFPFQNLEQLQGLQAAISKSELSIGNMLKGKMGEKDNNESADQQAIPPAPRMEDLMSAFDFNASDGLIKRSLNPEKLKAILQDPALAELKQSADMGIEILQTTTYTLPRPVKKVSNAGAKISDDKFKVTIQQNLLDIFTNPEKFEFSIQY